MKMGEAFRSKEMVALGLVVLLGMMASCGGDDDGGTQPPPPAGQIIGSAGGTATSADGNATVVIPAGALAADTEITVAAAASPPPGAVTGTAFTFGPSGTQFTADAAVTVGYDPAFIPVGTDPDSLQLCLADGGGWTSLAAYTHDTTEHTLSGAVAHFSTYGIVVEDSAEPSDLTAYLKDSPDPGADDEFDSLADAMAWLEVGLGYEDTGTLVWQTDTSQQVESLAFSFDLVIAVDAGRTPAIEGPTSGALVIDAAGAVNLSAFAIAAPGGLVLNANRAAGLSGCDLPDDVTINLGGVTGTPYPAGDPGCISKSPAAHRRSRGVLFANNRGMQSMSVLANGAAEVDGDITVTGNETTHLMVGGTAVLVPNVCLTVTGAPLVPVPYPTISSNLGGTSSVVFKDFSNVTKAKIWLTSTGDNPVEVRNVAATVNSLKMLGSGHVSIMHVDSETDSTIIEAATAGLDLVMLRTNCRMPAMIKTGAATGPVDIKVADSTFELGMQVELPAGGEADATLDGTTHTGGQVVISGGGGGKAGAGPTRGAVNLTDLNWTGGGTDHIDIFAVDGSVTVSGGTYNHSGSPAVILGLTEVTGTITIEEVDLTGAGIGLVDCTGSTLISDATIAVTSGSAYGVSMGGCGGVTLQDCELTAASGGVGLLQVGEMDGSLTVTGCSLNGATAATVATFTTSNAAMDNNSLISGMIIIADSQLHMSGNTFSGATVIDDYANPGLQNDPVGDNDGLLPGEVMTRMDWDGNGCCDYPPEWNVQDEHGACVVCQGVGGKVMKWIDQGMKSR